MALKDLIRGRVTSVIDGKTVEMEVSRVVRKNNSEYSRAERVRVADIKPFLFVKKSGYGTKQLLEKIVLAKELTCLVHGRDRKGQLEADLYLL